MSWSNASVDSKGSKVSSSRRSCIGRCGTCDTGICTGDCGTCDTGICTGDYGTCDTGICTGSMRRLASESCVYTREKQEVAFDWLDPEEREALDGL
ncbi:hypothetical protein TNCV_157061 [Trichonephila clavipes]|nr:hypothetical protein TNCV_157061 [Trichonephila clavipes]